MARSHSIHGAKTHLSRLIVQAGRGEEVIITRGSVPVARLVPIQETPRGRVFGAMRGRARVTPAFFESLPQADLDAWGEGEPGARREIKRATKR